jgi:hypothetical protein
MNKHKYYVKCGGNTSYRIYVRKSFMFIPYWSYMCTEPTFESCSKLINNLSLINAKITR